MYQVPNHKPHLLAIYIISHLPLIFISPTSQKNCFIRPLFRSRFSLDFLLGFVTMSDFGMAETDDGLTPKLDELEIQMQKLLFWGKGMLQEKNVSKNFFNCVENLCLDDVLILKRTKSYAEAISALVLKLGNKFICTHPTLQRLFFELPVINNPKSKKLSTLVLMNEFDYIVWEAREFFYFYGINRENL